MSSTASAFVALLRGINVGKAKRVPMAELRRLLQELGHTEVATLLNSGNAVFCAPRAASATFAPVIAAAIKSGLNVEVPVIVKSATELEAIIRENPFATDAEDHSRLLVAFTQEVKSLADLAPVAALALPPDGMVIGKHAAYLHCPGGILESKAAEAMLGKPGRMATTRNWATTLKIQALLAERSAK